jgi:hypothetical protein
LAWVSGKKFNEVYVAAQTGGWNIFNFSVRFLFFHVDSTSRRGISQSKNIVNIPLIEIPLVHSVNAK